jgi:hypothetical protein
MNRKLLDLQAEMRERLARPVTEKKPAQSVREVPDTEPPYTVAEVATLTGLSVQTIIRLFEHERGVIIYEEKRPRKRASYRTIRIPRYVYRRVLQKLSVQ